MNNRNLYSELIEGIEYMSLYRESNIDLLKSDNNKKENTMRSDVNTVVLTGRLTKDPENRETPEGVHVTDLTLASNHYTSSGKQYPTYVRVTLWKKAAEVLGQKLRKGDFVHVQGMLVNDDFVTNDGVQTNGRMKIDHASVKLLRSAFVEDSEEE